MPMWVIIIIGVVLGLLVLACFAFRSGEKREKAWQVTESEKFERDETAAGRKRPSIPVWRGKPKIKNNLDQEN